MTTAQLRMLMALGTEGPSSSKELQEVLGIGKSAVHKRLIDLQSAGLVVGEKSTEPVAHRPRYLFRLTDDGVGALKDAERELENALSSLRR